MKRIHYYSIAAIVAVLLAAAFVFLNPQLLQPNYRYSVEEGGVVFQSNEYAPGQYLNELALKPKFVIAPEVVESGPINSYMSQALNVFAGVLEFNSRGTIAVLRVRDQKGIAYCQTNYGNTKENKPISFKECDSILGDKNSVVILIDLPDSSLRKPRVVLETNLIHLMPKSQNDAVSMPQLVLKAMYSNSQDALDKINEIVAKTRNTVNA